MSLTGFSTEALAWWVWHMDNGGCERCPSTTEQDNPELAARVRAEFATRTWRAPRDQMERRRVREESEHERPARSPG